MKLFFFTIPIYGDDSSNEELNRLLASHRVVAVDRELVQDGSQSAWAVCVTVHDGVGSGKSASKSKDRVDYREILSPEDFALFSKLRDRRKEIADAENVPAYALFTNAQLAEMVVGRVDSRAAVGRIAGVGASRVEKYADEFLKLIQEQPGATSASPDDSDNAYEARSIDT